MAPESEEEGPDAKLDGGSEDTVPPDVRIVVIVSLCVRLSLSGSAAVSVGVSLCLWLSSSPSAAASLFLRGRVSRTYRQLNVQLTVGLVLGVKHYELHVSLGPLEFSLYVF